MVSIWRHAVFAAALLAACPAIAQDREEPDRTDPAVIQQDLERQERQKPLPPRVEVTAPQQGQAAAPADEIVAGAIRVVGARALPAAAFAQAIQPYLGRTLEQADLVRLATDVAGVMRRAGYGLATAWVPAQDVVGAILTVEVDEGRIDAIRASGPGARLVERHLAGIVGGGPVVTSELERQLLLVGDMAGLWVGDARLVREGERNILTVATRFDRVRGSFTIDNRGTSSAGPVRAWADVGVNGFLTRGDGLTLGFAATPLDPSELQLVEGRYRLPIGRSGTALGVGGYFGRTRSEGSNGRSGFEGSSSELEVEVVQPLARSRASSLWFTGRFELRDSELERAQRVVRDDRLSVLTASLYGYQPFAGGRLRGRLSVVQGVDAFGATRRGDPLASRADAGGVFTKFEGWAEYWRWLGGGFSTEVAMRTQIADGPLLSSEEMGLGGPQFLRAFNYRERSGDEGVAASAELRFDLEKLTPAIDRVQLYAFGDAGSVRNHGNGRRGGSLASAGGGARISITDRWHAGAELAVPLSDGAFEEDPAPRFSFSITARF